MNNDRSRFLERAENAMRESKALDFKREFDIASAAEWSEIIKDIVAFANSGGGVIVFGVDNNGSSAGNDISDILSLDIADMTNKIQSLTGYQFSDLEVVEVNRGGEIRAALIIFAADVPLVFIRPGADVTVKGKQRSAFAQGTVYFRHGAKSEPGNRDDLFNWLQDAIERVRKDWLGGIRKVVSTPPGHAINVISSPRSRKDPTSQTQGVALSANIIATPGAVSVVPRNAEEIWPHRQKALLGIINKQLKVQPAINGHDILCLNSHLSVLKDHPKFAYKPHSLASPQYSNEYADWIVGQYTNDPKFFQRLREEFKKQRAGKTRKSKKMKSA
jgi:hypothetical protein